MKDKNQRPLYFRPKITQVSKEKDNKPSRPATLGFTGIDDAQTPEPLDSGDERQKTGLEGRRIGNYVAVSLIGRGGMGSVYLARHPEIGRRVAIKVLSPELASMPQAVERFISEAKAIAAIEHPNVIDIYDFGRMENGRAYHVMELLKGRELASVINRKGKWTAEEFLPLLRQICAGLQAAHEKGIVHRDLKPENIFVLDRGPDMIKILDFGIAKLLENRSGPSFTTPGTVIGTPMVIAPEQAAGDSGRVGPWTDIYSLGVIMYWMLAGRPPFLDEASGVLLARHILNEPPPLTEVEPSVPRALAGLVHQCLTKDPEGRPESARKIAEAFAIALGQDPQPLPGFQTHSEARQPDADDSRRLLPIESATTIGGDTGEEGIPAVPSVDETVTLMGHSQTLETPASSLPARETTGGASAGEVSSSGQTLLQMISQRRNRWLVLAATVTLVAAVAFMVSRPTPSPDDVPLGGGVISGQQWTADVTRPAPDSRGPLPDASPLDVSPTTMDATPVRPDRARKVGTKGTGGSTTRMPGKNLTTRPDNDNGTRKPRPDSAVRPTVTPVPEPDKVGAGTLDPFGDVKMRKKEGTKN